MFSNINRKRKLLLYICLALFMLALLFVPRLHKIPSANQTIFPSPNQGTKCSPESFKDVTVSQQYSRVRFSGSTSFAPLNEIDVLAAILNSQPKKFRLEYVDPARYGESPGSGTGIKWLIQDERELTFAHSSRPFNQKEIDEMKQKNLKLVLESVAIDIIAIYVNPTLLQQGLQSLTLDQVREIFTGRITNWKDIKEDLKDQEIIPYKRSDGSGTVDSFKEKVLNGQDFGKKVKLVSSKKENLITSVAIRNIAKIPGAISFATTSELINQSGIVILPIAKDDPSAPVSPCDNTKCETVNEKDIKNKSYPEELSRELLVVIKTDDPIKKELGEAYVNMLRSCEGQTWIRKKGFLPINN
ncbi:substrate-binding domain-containing protein [Nostoc spongiaeforme FACHB-130]|uniref:Substrate-binding domain-containing protein n=1 Tax=Nostoc spongiaeforme FACHB-130 TaxID=1357510 RepID=A0ABR8G4Z5_9NOSO|nr:substrate-binding domain-containing protein [Nostoc spongiaeforme]MBD2598310.1 substrate-binding domain-containing protein [Nostoc spongiaeforme FACHB-130]